MKKIIIIALLALAALTASVEASAGCNQIKMFWYTGKVYEPYAAQYNYTAVVQRGKARVGIPFRAAVVIHKNAYGTKYPVLKMAEVPLPGNPWQWFSSTDTNLVVGVGTSAAWFTDCWGKSFTSAYLAAKSKKFVGTAVHKVGTGPTGFWGLGRVRLP